MLRVVLEITGNVDDARAVCEKLATDFEKYGDVRVVEVTETKPEQMKMEGFEGCFLNR